MFVRNGQALGSINHADLAALAEPKAARPEKKKTPKPVEPKPQPQPQPVPIPELPEPELDDGVVEPPKEYAAKGEWVDFAVSQGADRDEAEQATKHELIEIYGGAS